MSACLCGRDHDADHNRAEQMAVESEGFVELVGDAPQYSYTSDYDGDRRSLYDAVALCVNPGDDGRKVWTTTTYRAEPDGYIRVSRDGVGVAASHRMAVEDAHRWLAQDFKAPPRPPLPTPDWVNG